MSDLVALKFARIRIIEQELQQLRARRTIETARDKRLRAMERELEEALEWEFLAE